MNKVLSFLVSYLFLSNYAVARDIIAWAILADRETKFLQKTYSPVIEYFNQRQNLFRLEFKILSQEEFYNALRQNQLHLVTVSPSHYHAIRHHNALVSILATELAKHGKISTESHGSAIFTLKGQGPKNLCEIKNVKVAAMVPTDFFGYQLPMSVLKNCGALKEKDLTLIFKPTYDAVVKSVLAQETVVGFVRTGVLEDYGASGIWEKIEILEKQNLANYPFASSTVIYPGQAVLALPILPQKYLRHISSLLLSLDSDHPVLRHSTLGGFAPPADYFASEELARKFRFFPFEKIPVVTPADIWNRYRIPVVILMAFLLVVILLSLLLWYRNRELYLRGKEIQKQKARLDAILEHTQLGLWEWDAESQKFVVNFTFAEILGYKPEDLTSLSFEKWEEFIHKDDLLLFEEEMGSCLAGRNKLFAMELRMLRKDNTYSWYFLAGKSKKENSGSLHLSGILQNVETSLQKERQLTILLDIYAQMGEGILITTEHGEVIDLNAAFSRLTNLSRSEVIGKNIRDIFREKDFANIDPLQKTLQEKHWEEEIYWQIDNRKKIFRMLGQMLVDRFGEKSHIYLITDITEQVEYREKIERMALYDELTSLPNRHFFIAKLRESLEYTRETKSLLAVIYIDLDGFKQINDSLGHDIGDQVLQEISRRLRDSLRSYDTIARLGGDEFVAILNDLESKDVCLVILPRLLAAASRPIPVLGIPISVSASIGVTFFPQEEELDAEQLIRQADQAMYQAKLAGKNRYAFFDPEHDRHLRGIHQGMANLRTALEKEQFVLFYQPKVNMRSGKIIGVEALLRWQHPDSGLIPPAAFLGLIENHSLAVELGEWVIEKVLDTIAAGLIYPVSINISTYHLQQTDFLERLEYLLHKHGDVPPSMIELEILETGAMKDPQEMANLLRACHRLGVQFSLDDFGTGYSSLAYLRQLPVHALKIDRSFIKDILDDSEDLAILEGVLDMAGAFRKRVIAEGVETIEHGKMLLRLGCELAQGYAIAKPMPENELQSWLGQWRVPRIWSRQPTLVRSLYPLINALVVFRSFFQKLQRYVEGKSDIGPDTEHPEKEPLYIWIEQRGMQEFSDRSYWPEQLKLIRKIYALAGETMEYRQNGENAKALEHLKMVEQYLENFFSQMDIFILSLAGTIYDEKSLPLEQRTRNLIL